MSEPKLKYYFKKPLGIFTLKDKFNFHLLNVGDRIEIESCDEKRIFNSARKWNEYHSSGYDW